MPLAVLQVLVLKKTLDIRFPSIAKADFWVISLGWSNHQRGHHGSTCSIHSSMGNKPLLFLLLNNAAVMHLKLWG